MVASLGTVAAPNDFEFRLRARLAGEKNKSSHLFTIGHLSFGYRATAFAALVLLVGSAFLVLRLGPTSNIPVVAEAPSAQVKPSAPTQAFGAGVQAAAPSAFQATQSPKATNSGGTQPFKNPDFAKAGQLVSKAHRQPRSGEVSRESCASR